MAQDVSFPEQCHGYCFSVLQPLIDHVLKLKEATDDNDKMKVEKIHSLELTINNLQSQLLKSETEIKNNVEQIKVKDEQIKLKDDQIKQKDEQIKNLRKQIIGKVGEINGKDKEIIVKVEEIKNLREDVKMISSLNSGSDDIFKMKVKGWTVIQRRINGSVDFNRNWTDYKNGFGDERGSFFLGLETIHLMTLAQPHELYIQLRYVNGTTKYARYDDFKVGSENEAYKLKSLGEYSGTAGDSFSYHLDMKFSTLDRDNDLAESFNCASAHAGGWWFKNCSLRYSYL
ncbi:fibrinogen-like protein 1 [Drosophila obscura]|uniref:fibrinogen-like protein 1 n=1 Tax=Drosophila obscura TaxID=7282 RepID=UPI001BB1250B|nr:fibrinogen-like protein 1 [Drosophila obscura]